MDNYVHGLLKQWKHIPRARDNLRGWTADHTSSTWKFDFRPTLDLDSHVVALLLIFCSKLKSEFLLLSCVSIMFQTLHICLVISYQLKIMLKQFCDYAVELH